ncbi:MAG: repeat protein, partial [Verrucomicrobiales bacterium]|nr:repeat protein [Verrucomicrobiales bacterium]
IEGKDHWTTGVTLADVDGDGDQDLFCCNYETPNQLFINQGTNEKGVPAFKEAAVAAGVASVDSSHSASFVDYDRDGDLDLFVLTNKVEDPQGFPSVERAPVKFDGTSWRLLEGMDRYYSTWKYDAKNSGVEPAGRPDLLFRNDGPGPGGVPVFHDVTKDAGISGRGDGLSATWWDYNKDGWPDLFIGNDFLSEDRLWHNNGDGTFKNVLAQAVPHTCWFSMGADAGDLNNDLLPDFFLADMSATTHYKSKTTMGAMGGISLKRAVGSSPPQYMRNSCFLGTGTGRFLEAAYMLGIASTDWTWAVKFGDYDHDSKLDVYITNGVIRAMNHSDFVISDNEKPGSHLWQFYKDQTTRPEQHRVYKNEGDLHFHDHSDEWGLNRTAVTYGCASGDLDGDGDLDLVEINLEEPPTLYRNNASSRENANSVTFRFKGKAPNTDAIGTQIVLTTASGAQLRQLYPGSGYHSQNETLLHFGIGRDTVIDRVDVTWPDGGTERLVKLNANQLYLLTQDREQPPASPAPAPPALFAVSPTFPIIRHQEVPYDDYSDQLLLPHALSQMGPAIASADVNADGFPDFYLGGGAGQPGELRFGNNKGGFTAQWVDAFQADKAHEDMGAVFFDADNDGDPDLLVASGSYQFKEGNPLLADRLYLNDGKGGYTKAADSALPVFLKSSGPVAVADFDRDGDMDVYIGSRVVPAEYPLAPESRLLRNDSTPGSPRFTDVTEEVGGSALRKSGMVSGAVWSDVNLDGAPDLLLAHEWGTVKLLINRGGKLAERTSAPDDLAKNTGWWTSVETADLDGDGRLDLIAGNFGYNTKYKEATADKPKLLYYADCDNTGRKNIVEVKREGDTLYPERGRSCSSTAMPFLKTKFPTYHAFASASLKEVYGDSLEKGQKFEANTLGTGIYWNEGNDANGDPQFRFQPLERIAQVAPAFGIAVSDVNGDGSPDLCFAQNFHSPQIETGHYDGGLGQVMINNGKRSFSPMPAGTSGLVLPRDCKAAAAMDLNQDGIPDLLITTNNNAAVALLNQTAAPEHFLQVVLPSGKAAGTRVTLQQPGQPDRLMEYHAGAGYMSQAPSTLTFGIPGAATGLKLKIVRPDGKQEEREVPAGTRRIELGL